jgi:prolyl 4-hydroxylase
MLIEADFLTEHELVELIKLVRTYAQPPPPHNWPEGQCASLNVNLSEWHLPWVEAIERRIAYPLVRDSEFPEELRGVWYRPGEGYRLHHDAFYPETADFAEQVRDRGNRTATAMIYLNTLVSGGETYFPELGLTVAPRAGMLIAWRNLRDDKSPDTRMLHSANPARAVDKYIVTQWFRESGPKASG